MPTIASPPDLPEQQVDEDGREDLTPTPTNDPTVKDAKPDQFGFEPAFAPLYPPPLSFWVQFGIIAIMGAGMGLFGLGYVKAIQEVPQAWSQAGNSDYPDGNVSTLQWGAGKAWWIGIGAATGLVTALLKILFKADEYPSFIIELRERKVNPWISVQIFLLTLISEFGGASLGPESGLGAFGAMVGQVTAEFFKKRFKICQDIDPRLFVAAGIAAGFSAILPAPVIALLLCVELGVPLEPAHWAGKSVMHVLTLMATASTASYAVYYSLDTSTYLDARALLVVGKNTKEIDAWNFAVGILFGIMGSVLALCYMLVGAVVTLPTTHAKAWLDARFGKNVRILVVACTGGVLYGVLMYVCPMSVGSGESILGPVVQFTATNQMNAGLLISSAFTKLLAFWICKESGLVGGLVFPMLLSGLMVAGAFQIWTNVNFILAFSTGFIALVCAIIPSPFSFILLSFMSLVLGQQGLTPVFTCAFTAYLCCIGVGIPQYLMSLSAKRKK